LGIEGSNTPEQGRRDWTTQETIKLGRIRRNDQAATASAALVAGHLSARRSPGDSSQWLDGENWTRRFDGRARCTSASEWAAAALVCTPPLNEAMRWRWNMVVPGKIGYRSGTHQRRVCAGGTCEGVHEVGLAVWSEDAGGARRGAGSGTGSG
jgi:hypothetical protein